MNSTGFPATISRVVESLVGAIGDVTQVDTQQPIFGTIGNIQQLDGNNMPQTFDLRGLLNTFGDAVDERFKKQNGYTDAQIKKILSKCDKTPEDTSCSICYDEFALDSQLLSKEALMEKLLTKRKEQHQILYSKMPEPLQVFDADDPPITFPSDATATESTAWSYRHEPSLQKYIPDSIDLNNENASIDHSPMQLPCTHVFGGSCIAFWLKENSSCPLCRADLEKYLDESESGNSTSDFKITRYNHTLARTDAQTNWIGDSASTGWRTDDPPIIMPRRAAGVENRTNEFPQFRNGSPQQSSPFGGSFAMGNVTLQVGTANNNTNDLNSNNDALGISNARTIYEAMFGDLPQNFNSLFEDFTTRLQDVASDTNLQFPNLRDRLNLFRIGSINNNIANNSDNSPNEESPNTNVSNNNTNSDDEFFDASFLSADDLD
ncbi:hypothetical protein DAMA08_050680 [Martiniozyma asiatica (nom. inval.)]|nr:hypothetical protein DAMA08_050680 [Martiniozyma asiatica]